MTMNNNKISDVISRTEVFKGLNGQELAVLAAAFTEKPFREGDEIVQEGRQGEHLSIVTGGILRVVLDDENDNVERFSKITLNTLLEGDIFGEYSLIDEKPVSASIIAEEGGELLRIGKNDFQKILDENPQIANTVYRNMLELLISRLRKHDEELDMFT